MKCIRKMTAILLAMLLVLSVFPAVASAALIRTASMEKELQTSYTFLEPKNSQTASVNSSSTQELPSSYDSRSFGYVTQVKNQGAYGTCWSFCTMAPIETYMIKHGVIDATTGQAATNSIDLSESHLAWFNFTAAYDRLNLLSGDSSNPSVNYLSQGGMNVMTTYTLMRGAGPTSEAVSALQYPNVSSNGLDPAYAYDYNVAQVTDVTWIPASDRDAVKNAIMEYGAGSIGYFHDGNCFNSSTGAFYSSGYTVSNHGVTVVGWDDNYSRNNFLAAKRPQNDGAWIIKNSWGTNFGLNGYFYLSYEDSASSLENFFFYKVENLNPELKCYQYDGTCNNVSYQSMGNQSQVCNVFTAIETESIQSVALATMDAETSYTLSIYLDPSETTNPSSGNLVYTQSGFMPFAGYHSVELDNPVVVPAGSRFAVAFTLSTSQAANDGTYVHIPYDASATETEEPYVDHPCTWVHVDHGESSFYREANGVWTDCPDYGDFRIKAYAQTVPFLIEAVSNDPLLGSVTVDHNTILATPAEGYYVSGWELQSGTASCSIEGNVIHVTASSDCTIRVLFAPVPLCTVSFNTCGIISETRTAYLNDTMTLPQTVSLTPDDWSFLGWMSQPLEQTDAEPDFYAPGVAYRVQGNAVLYALYTHTEGMTQIGYQLLTAAPASWEGNYVITYTANPSTMRVLKGVDSSIMYMSNPTCAPALSSTGITLDQDLLTNVDSIYQFTISTQGSNYWIQNVSSGMYVGGSTVLYSVTQRYSTMLPWTLSFSNGSVHMKNNYKGNYMSYNGSSFVLGSTNNNICLWKEVPVGTSYYATVFEIAAHEHELEAVPAAAPNCTTAGHTAYFYCAGCGRYFSDADAETEILPSDPLIPALGHSAGEAVTENQTAPSCGTAGSYDLVVSCVRCGAELSREHYTIPATGNHSFGAWTTNQNGTHTRSCSACGTTETAACSYNDVVTPPTVTEQGFTTHSCTVCGYSYVDQYTPALGFDYLVSFSVPNGVAPVAPMSCNSNASITLPTAGAPAGCSFLGWVSSTVSGSEQMPSNILTGAYTPSGNVTLYALYSYTEGSGGVGFQLLTAAPASWEGNYVITYTANPSTMRVLKGVDSSIMYMSNPTCAPALSGTGITVNQNLMTNVDSIYQFTISTQGSNYWIQNVSSGMYVGGATVLYSVTERYSTMLPWTLSFSNGSVHMKNNYKGNYMSYNGSYFVLGSTNNNICLWKETTVGTTHYSTDPILD